MDNMQNNQQQAACPPPYWQMPVKKEPEKYPMGKKEAVFGIALALCAMGFTNGLFYGGYNLGFGVFGMAIILLSTGYLISRGKKPGVYSTLLLSLSFVICGGFLRGNDNFVKFIMNGFLFFGVNLALCIQAGQTLYHPGSFSSLGDAFRTGIGLGVGKLAESFRGIRYSMKNGKSGSKRSMELFLGLVIAVPILAIMIPLLISADAAFDGLMGMLPELEGEEIFATLITGFVAWSVLFTQAVALIHSKKETPAAKKPHKGAAAVTVNTVLIAVGFVYCVYLISQLAYFTGGFSGILPEEYTLAQYARRGFFEMAGLCLLNLGVILLCVGIVRKQTKVPGLTRFLCLFIGIVTLLLVATASAKMLLYIGSYGLTSLRVLTEVIMVFLAVTTAVVCIWLFVPKLPYMKIIIITALLMGAVVLWADVDTVVAAYNVDAYLTGRLDTVDVEYLATLSDGAVPYIDKLTFCGDFEIENQALNALYRMKNQSDDIREWNYASHLAKQYLP